MKIKNYIFMLILLYYCVNIVHGEEYTFRHIDNCYGVVKIYERHNLSGYSVKDCNIVQNYWQCKCKNNMNLTLIGKLDERKYSFTIEYWLEKPLTNSTNDLNYRAYNEDSIILVNTSIRKQQEEKSLKEIFGGTKMEKNVLMVLIGGILVVVGIVSIILYKVFKKDSDENVEDIKNELKKLSGGENV